MKYIFQKEITLHQEQLILSGQLSLFSHFV